MASVGSDIRIVISLLVALVTTIFIFLWDSKSLSIITAPFWIGPYVIAPLIAVVFSFAANCIIQGLSCGEVQWVSQLQRVAVVPVPFIVLWLLLFFIPGMRWPIEGLIQTQTTDTKRGFSSAFYTFWVSMYIQSVLSGFSQIC
jgi:hypothetical protein